MPLNPGLPQHFLPFRQPPSCTRHTAALPYNQLTAVLHRFSILIASLCERRRAPVNGEAAARLGSRRGGDTQRGLKGSQCAQGGLPLFLLNKKRTPLPLTAPAPAPASPAPAGSLKGGSPPTRPSPGPLGAASSPAPPQEPSPSPSPQAPRYPDMGS